MVSNVGVVSSASSSSSGYPTQVTQEAQGDVEDTQRHFGEMGALNTASTLAGARKERGEDVCTILQQDGCPVTNEAQFSDDIEYRIVNIEGIARSDAKEVIEELELDAKSVKISSDKTDTLKSLLDSRENQLDGQKNLSAYKTTFREEYQMIRQLRHQELELRNQELAQFTDQQLLKNPGNKEKIQEILRQISKRLNRLDFLDTLLRDILIVMRIGLTEDTSLQQQPDYDKLYKVWELLEDGPSAGTCIPQFYIRQSALLNDEIDSLLKTYCYYSEMYNLLRANETLATNSADRSTPKKTWATRLRGVRQRVMQTGKSQASNNPPKTYGEYSRWR